MSGTRQNTLGEQWSQTLVGRGEAPDAEAEDAERSIIDAHGDRRWETQTSPEAPHFSSSCRARKVSHEFSSRGAPNSRAARRHRTRSS